MFESLLPLTEKEKKMKQIYVREGKEMLSRPMSYAQYCKMMEENMDFLDLTSFYSENTKGKLGNTISDVEDISGEEIDLQRHERYGYPLIHNHAFVEMIYVAKGNCLHYIEEKNFSMKEGDFCVLAPNSKHVVIANNDETVILNILLSTRTFDTSFLQILKEKYLLADFFRSILYDKKVSPYILFHTGADKKIQEFVWEMYLEKEKQAYGYQEVLLLYTKLLLIRLVRSYEMMAVVAAPLEKDQKQNRNITALLGYISVNYNQVTLKEVSRFFNYNEAYLSRLIKQYTGKTFSELVSSLQMRHAKEMIDEGVMNLTEISQEVGCFDTSHFNKKFKKIYGKTPDEYRKKL